MAIARQLVTRDYVEVVRTDGEIWSITRDQVLAMLGAMPRNQALNGIKESLGTFLGYPPEEINARISFATFLTGEIQELTIINQ